MAKHCNPVPSVVTSFLRGSEPIETAYAKYLNDNEILAVFLYWAKFTQKTYTAPLYRSETFSSPYSSPEPYT